MSPEFGSTIAVFPIDEQTVEVPPAHRPPRRAARAGRGLRQGAGPLARPERRAALLSERLELDLSTVVPSLAGPKRPQDRVEVTEAAESFAKALADYTDDTRRDRARSALDGQEVEIGHGAVAIAAITSCTNTSNPSVMIGAALLAKNAVEKGLERKPWVKTSLAPGLQGGQRLLRAGRPHAVPRQARLQPRRLRLYDVHRQLRPAHPRGQRRGQRERPRRRLACCRATATSRAGSTPT